MGTGKSNVSLMFFDSILLLSFLDFELLSRRSCSISSSVLV